MEETKKTVTLKAIEPGSIVKIDIGEGFYNRVQSLLFDHINSVEPEISIKALNELKSREPIDKFEANLLTLLTLVYACEGAFHAQGFTKDTEVAIPNN